MSKRSIAVFIAVTCLLHCFPVWRFLQQPGPNPPMFESRAVNAQAAEAPFIETEFISREIGSGIAHVGSICELKDGRLTAVWYSGSREGGKDVAIYFGERGPGENVSWSEPRVVVDRESARKELRRYVRKVGNPVIFADRDDRLWLVYVTVAVGGWSGSSLNVKKSDDGGHTWTPSERVTLSPFFNVSELVKNKPLELEGKGFVVPIYHEFIGKFSELLWIDSYNAGNGFTWRKTRMTAGRDFIQPSLLAYDRCNGLSFYRNCSKVGSVGMATTGVAGVAWSKPCLLEIPNPDSGLDTLLMSDKSILMAFNDAKRGRENLRLAVSTDGGNNWSRIATLENTPGGVFSYPYLIRGKNGCIHLVYTYMNMRIKHVTMNEAWIRAQMGSG